MSSLMVPSAEELTAMSSAEREQVIQALDSERRRVEAAIATVMQRVEACGGHLDDGHRTVRAWGRAACNWSSTEAFHFSRVARMFTAMPTAAEAAAQGRIGVAQLHALAAVAANPRVRHHLADGEADLVVQASQLDHDDYAMFLHQWTAAADPDGTRADHDRAHRERRAHLSIAGCRMYLDAMGGTAAGAAMKEILDAFAHSEFLADWEEGLAQHGEAMAAHLMARTDSQRRFDAMFAIFLAAASGAGSSSTGAAPTVNLVMGHELFEHHLTRMLGGRPDPLAANDPLHRCETSDGIVVDPYDVIVAAAIGHVRRVVVDSAGVIIDQGRKQRLFTGPLREAVLMMARRCVWPGCHRPASKCDADHLLPYANAGPTATWNSGPACPHHNHWKNGGYTTRRDSEGRWHTYRPDGSEVGWRAFEGYGSPGNSVTKA